MTTITLDIRARSAANGRVDDTQEFEEMAASFFRELRPSGQVRMTLFDELVTAAWGLRRLRRVEVDCCPNAESLAALLDDEAVQKRLDRLARHHTRLECTFHRCLKELRSMGGESDPEPSGPVHRDRTRIHQIFRAA